MKRVSNVDLGSVQIHKKAIADIVSSAISDIDGVKLIPKDITYILLEFLGKTDHPGIGVKVDTNNQVSIEIKVLVRYGLNIQDLARHIQGVVRSAIEKTVDIDLKDVNINIQGIEKVDSSAA